MDFTAMIGNFLVNDSPEALFLEHAASLRSHSTKSDDRKDVRYTSSTRQSTATQFRYGLLCFSNNRPFQLGNMLESFVQHSGGHPNKAMCIYKSDEEWAKLYDTIFAKYTWCESISETNFQDDLSSCLDTFMDTLGSSAKLLVC
jgi:hypothetical protein